MSDPSAALRVAIVGCGPKGLYALERLTTIACERVAPGRVHVDVFEPHPHPGAGPWYDPAQPEYLRMNFAAEMVDMWPPGRKPDPLRPSFSEWRARREGADDESYPARASVGRYLADGLGRLRADAGDAIALELIPERVTAVERTTHGWAAHAAMQREYDEILLATGHTRSWRDSFAPTAARKRIPFVFPVERCLSAHEVPPSRIVAVRGFALTMIDATLALTEGRGGTFSEGKEAHFLRYEEGAADVARIIPYSRTGRPMLAKPDPARGPASQALETVASDGRAAIKALPPQSPLDAACGIVSRVAADSLHSFGGDEAAAIERRLGDALAGRASPSGLSPAAEIEHSIAVGVGLGKPGVDWALGHAWRAVYPAVVERLGANGLPDDDWGAFRRLSAEMERIAFGPPPVNAAKLLALIESGTVDLSRLRSGPAPEATVEIDAVIPPPGALNASDPVLDALLSHGHVRIPRGRRGIELTRDVTCVAADGEPSNGLGAIGRPTEDWVIGNDTLNRSLHPQAELWAQRVVARANS